ncbi:hypothetical protein [Acidithiobacillus acidisediminis]|uniref:hypothetical protein n=1 Tax=Acidithiobacillus acidisediminis TaxID=2937799 RepID=UPI00183C1F0C|nr:hypothetical protein [Acidithiobacillus sp. S30A2]
MPLRQLRGEDAAGVSVSTRVQSNSRRGRIIGPDGEPIPLKISPEETVWQPRWKWVGKLLGRSVPAGQDPSVQALLRRVYWTVEVQETTEALQGNAAAPTTTAESPQTKSTRAAPASGGPAQAAPVPAEPAKAEPAKADSAKDAEASEEKSVSKGSIKEWAMPLLVVFLGAILIFAMGTLLGYALATGHAAPNFLAAIVYAPTGSLLLLLGGLACLVQGHEESKVRYLWLGSGWILLLVFAWSLLGGYF